MSSKERILAHIRELQRKPAHPSAEEIDAVRSHVTGHPRNAQPRDTWEPQVRFKERALSLASSYDEAPTIRDVPEAVARYLKERSLPMAAVCWREFLELDWAAHGVKIEV